MNLQIGIVGATGIVGSEFLSLLAERKIPVGTLRLFASEKSEGKLINFGDYFISVEKLEASRLKNLDYLFFCAGAAVSEKYVPVAAANGICCIDNSSAFREYEDVPLVIPEINPHALGTHKNIIANPNCSTIIALMAMFPLHQQFGLRRFCAATYQAVSGVGCGGIRALEQDMDGPHTLSREIFGEQILFNAIPKIGSFAPNGYTSEEMKMLHESRKILSLPHLRVSSTCVRIPVKRVHSIAAIAEFDKPFEIHLGEQVLRENSSIDYFTSNEFPSPTRQENMDNVAVGRLRVDTFLDNGASMWIVGDQVRKGAALNAIQIMEHLEQLKILQTSRKETMEAVPALQKSA
ncbi:MAG: aspartate-semialdehyde dehydrogenase [Puniceicoccales bacterium]|jgi:aspartate-semialdehyde dehydrogenase|nr:aspartate-semialdehyde dehydrogenase [Puniceicoccales bacterium]